MYEARHRGGMALAERYPVEADVVTGVPESGLTAAVGYAEKAGCDYEVDVYYQYGTDANAAVRAGNNLRAGTFGMAVWCSHGMERTHISGLLNTTNLLLGYVLDI